MSAWMADDDSGIGNEEMASFIFNIECLSNEMLWRNTRSHLVRRARRLELYFRNQNQDEYILYKFNLLGNAMQL